MSRKCYTAEFCVNDEHGCFAGRAMAVEIWRHTDDGMEPMIELSAHVFDEQADDWVGLPFHYELDGNHRVRAIEVGGLRVPVISGPRSGGNWSWDVVTMSLDQVCRLLNHLKAARHRWPNGGMCHVFDLDQAEDKFWHRWQDQRSSFRCSAKAPAWFRLLPRKTRRKFNRQLSRTRCLRYR